MVRKQYIVFSWACKMLLPLYVSKALICPKCTFGGGGLVQKAEGSQLLLAFSLEGLSLDMWLS